MPRIFGMGRNASTSDQALSPRRRTVTKKRPLRGDKSISLRLTHSCCTGVHLPRCTRAALACSPSLLLAQQAEQGELARSRWPVRLPQRVGTASAGRLSVVSPEHEQVGEPTKMLAHLPGLCAQTRGLSAVDGPRRLGVQVRVLTCARWNLHSPRRDADVIPSLSNTTPYTGPLGRSSPPGPVVCPDAGHTSPAAVAVIQSAASASVMTSGAARRRVGDADVSGGGRGEGHDLPDRGGNASPGAVPGLVEKNYGPFHRLATRPLIRSGPRGRPRRCGRR